MKIKRIGCSGGCYKPITQIFLISCEIRILESFNPNLSC